MKASELVSVIRKAQEQGYRYFGIRTLCEDEKNVNIGEIARESYDWDMAEDCSTYDTTKETLGGTCVTGFDIENGITFGVSECEEDPYADYEESDEDLEKIITTIMKLNDYASSNTKILAVSKEFEFGNDIQQREMILQEALVIAKWEE